MISEKTLFILGAGASLPYGYPSGKDLRKSISFNFVNDYVNYFCNSNVDQNNQNYINYLRKFSNKFYKSSNKSIDLFLSRNPEFNSVGKLAITLEIFKAEFESNFREKISNVNQDWYSYLFDRLTNTFKNKDQFKLSENEISFITFNYDRSLQQFLFESLFNSFESIKDTEAANEIRNIPILHVYGQIAPLPWESHNSGISYKRKIMSDIIDSANENIKLIDENNNSDIGQNISEMIRSADRIFFLGFGYAKENLEVLNFPYIIKEEHKIFGTGLGLTDREITEISNTFFYPGLTNSKNIIIKNNFDNLQLIREYL